MNFSVQTPTPLKHKNQITFLHYKRRRNLTTSSTSSYHLYNFSEKKNLDMSRNSANIFFFFFLISLIILSQETQAGHHYSPAPEPVAHEPGKAPGPVAAQPITLPMYGATPGSLHPQECSGRCGSRCSATAYKKPCLFFCQKCCSTCLCVPPGTYGNKQFCPCYNNWKTKRGGPKCP